MVNFSALICLTKVTTRGNTEMGKSSTSTVGCGALRILFGWQRANWYYCNFLPRLAKKYCNYNYQLFTNRHTSYLSRADRIKAHFLTCFISLVIVRLIQKKTDNTYSSKKLIETMNAISCSHEGGNLYLFDHRSEISDALGKAFDIDFSMLRLTRAEIKKILPPPKSE